jgi:hypothetical protein
MFLFALACMLLFLNGAARLANQPWMLIATWTTWLIVGVGASSIVAGQSIKAGLRLGIVGWTRPRWWFELSRLLWIAGLFLGLTTGFALLAPANKVGRWLKGVTEVMFGCSKLCFCAFFLAATIGYALSFIGRRPRTGRAFECTHYFYVGFGGIGLITYAAIAWPPQRLWPDGVLSAISGAIAVAVFIFGGASLLTRSVRNEARRNL